jgi:uncharacterized membrane protein YesL
MSPGRPTFREQFIEVYIASVDLITANVVWFLLCLPLVTVFPATCGLYYAMNHFAHGRVGNGRLVWEGFRQYFWLSWKWGLSNLVVFGLLWVNIDFYRQFEAGWAAWARTFMILFFILWGLLQLYTFPLLLEQEEPRLRTALRNSLVLFIRRPLQMFGWSFAIFTFALGSSSLLPPAWIVITASLCLYSSNRATIDGIAHVSKPSLPALDE